MSLGDASGKSPNFERGSNCCVERMIASMLTFQPSRVLASGYQKINIIAKSEKTEWFMYKRRVFPFLR
jgi:hypothetical protein